MSTKTTIPTLRTLAEDKVEGVSKQTTFRLDPNLIKFEKNFNLRDKGPDLDEHIEKLYQAYKAGDMVPDIDVTVDEDGNVIARDGHCRTTAAKRVRKEIPDFTIGCRQFRGNDVDAVIHMLNSGTGGKRLTPLEEGRGYLRLLKMGLTPVEIAGKRHVSRVTIDNGITLAEAPAEVQQMISAGEVSATTARDAIKGGKEAVKALKEAVGQKRSAPAETPKNGAKGKPAMKKVTAKTLRGTAAEKKPKAKKTKPVISDEISFTLKKYDARVIADVLAQTAETDAAIQAFVTELETALL